MTGDRQRLARRAFTVVAVLEALTWLGLLVGMWFKHVAGTTEAGVELFGPLHGGAFVLYVLTALVAARVLRWRTRVVLLALMASVPPLGTLVFELWLGRTRRATAAAVG